MSSIRLSLLPRWCGVFGLVAALILPAPVVARIPSAFTPGQTYYSGFKETTDLVACLQWTGLSPSGSNPLFPVIRCSIAFPS